MWAFPLKMKEKILVKKEVIQKPLKLKIIRQRLLRGLRVSLAAGKVDKHMKSVALET